MIHGLRDRVRMEVAFRDDSAGVQARTGTSLFYPPQVPDLIGVEARKYLDHTGLVRQRSIGDLMRYAALNQAIDRLSRFGDFQPAAESFPPAGLTDPARLPAAKFAARYSDEQLYALALYLYSLRPPPIRIGLTKPRRLVNECFIARAVPSVIRRLSTATTSRRRPAFSNRLHHTSNSMKFSLSAWTRMRACQ